MIIINLKGGLGNQMFQYACGRALSLSSGDADLKINIMGLQRANEIGNIYRPFSLQYFDIKAGIATAEETEAAANPLGIISKVLRYAKAKFLYNFYIHYVPSIMKKRGTIYLDGYFQSEKYFMGYEKQIKEDLTLKEPTEKLMEWAKKIASEKNSVSLHVRRGDYVGHATLGGICTPEYYISAVERMTASLDVPRFYIFSDDVQWVKDTIPLPADTEYVSAPGMQDYEELAIMSKCRHNIISNSSFSWWGAWLNPNPEKIVIAPKVWVKGPRAELQNTDILPGSWTKM